MLKDDRRLSAPARALLEDETILCVLSAASVWEASIKRRKGRLTFPDRLWQDLYDAGFQPLDVTGAHGRAAGALPAHHRDPFDRMLVAQAQLEGLSIITADPAIAKYAVHVVPA